MSVHLENLTGIAFLPFPDMKEMMLTELKERFSYFEEGVSYGELVYFSNYDIKDSFGNYKIPYWAKCAMLKPFLIHFDSIGEAATTLKNMQRSWAPYNFTSFRRAALIQEKLPYVNLKSKSFPTKIPNSPIGLWSLLDNNTIIASKKTSSPLPAGTLSFVEDHENPPSRAYLKIQESLTLADFYFNCGLPSSSSKCFEAGACPGGWTYVLVNLGSKVFAVDRSELDSSLMKNPLVEFLAHDAFTLKPQELGEFDWVFSDVICYPERLLEWIKTWLESGKTKKMICTIKMQGAINWQLISKFEEIPNSKIVHLNYNKHELTFIHCEM